MLLAKATANKMCEKGDKVSPKLRQSTRTAVPAYAKGDDSELGGMTRAQSLRDLTSKFEKMGNPASFSNSSKGNCTLMKHFRGIFSAPIAHKFKIVITCINC